MFKKIFCAVVLVAFISVQLVNSLSCYQCTDISSCKNPSPVTCTNATALSTVSLLKNYFIDVPATNSTNFDCLTIDLTNSTSKQMVSDMSGCIYQEIKACSLVLKNSVNITKHCTQCSKDYCNRNPAATFSSSSITIGLSLVALLIAKLLA